MATRYDSLTEDQIKEVYDIPYKVMGPFTSVQNCTFPIKGIKEGMAADMTPEQVGDKAYNEIAKLTVGQFNDIETGKLRDLGRFMQGAVTKRLNELIK